MRQGFNVELTDGGDVYINGNFVEQLCFDGESLGGALAYYYDHPEEFKKGAGDE